MVNITLTEQDFNNLRIFLERVNLTGKEVIAFVSIMQSLSKAEPLELPEVTNDSKKEVK